MHSRHTAAPLHTPQMPENARCGQISKTCREAAACTGLLGHGGYGVYCACRAALIKNGADVHSGSTLPEPGPIVLNSLELGVPAHTSLVLPACNCGNTDSALVTVRAGGQGVLSKLFRIVKLMFTTISFTITVSGIMFVHTVILNAVAIF